LVETGPCLRLDVDGDTNAQLEWLERHDPAYLLTYPSLAAELATLSLERGVKLPGLREVRSLGESLEIGVRHLCKQAWNVPLTDIYSSEEVGYVALQCPDHEHYHVQAENVLVEVLNEKGKPCAPGETGRVVVTDLHNFAMPVIRYDIGDYAEVGEPCPCGRGLPVLRRLVGRASRM
jgi:phenylacetate-CoA ligase